jgi:hypothetical protein
MLLFPQTVRYRKSGKDKQVSAWREKSQKIIKGFVSQK